MIRYTFLKKWFILLLPTLFLAGSVQAQSLVEAEYFFDNDPGVGNGTDLNITQADTVDFVQHVPTTGLSEGFHKVFVRFKDTANRWSLYEGRTFYIQAESKEDTAAPIVAAEYFFDNDPGVGNGTSINISPADTVNLLAHIPSTGLSEGFHKAYVRFKDSTGQWGLYEGRTFFIQAAPEPDSTAPIVAAEYFIDNDPGIGQGTSVPVTAVDTLDRVIDAATSGVDTGVHYAYVRVKDAGGQWSLYARDTFEVFDCPMPNAQFSVNDVCLGEMVQFIDQSSNVDPASTYEWDVDNDGNTDYTTKGDVQHGYASPGTYEARLKITYDNNCKDSTNTQTVTVRETYTNNETAAICKGDSVLLEGAWQTSEGTYYDTFTTVHNCDSVISTDLTVNSPDTSVTVNDNTLTASATDAQYQWLDCENNYMPVQGATSRTFTATESGEYAVEVEKDNCADTSRCVAVNTVGVEAQPLLNKVEIYPNPTSDRFTIELGNIRNASVRIQSIDGRDVMARNVDKGRQSFSLKDQAPGVYFVEVISDKGMKTMKVVKQ